MTSKPLFPFIDLKAQYSTIRSEVERALATVLESQQFILGPELRAFESEFAAFLDGQVEAVGCASGSDALMLALRALELGPGDEVITTPFTFIATAGAIARLGARPVFADIEPRSFNIDPAAVAAATGPRTRAVIAVHLYGLCAEMGPLLELGARQPLALIEDVAQAIGARYRGRAAGTIGSFGCFSFFPSKNLGGAGDGGLICAGAPEMAEKLRLLRDHGSRHTYRYELLGVNSRLDELQAAVLRIKLRYLAQWTAARRRKAARYRELFDQAGLGASEAVELPQEPPGLEHVYNQFVLRCQRRDQLQEFLRARGIPSAVYYPLALHMQPAFAWLGYKPGQFPHAEAACTQVLALPIYPELSEVHQAAVVGAIADFYAGRAAG